MAKYVFNCEVCGSEKGFSMSISDFQKRKEKNTLTAYYVPNVTKVPRLVKNSKIYLVK